MEFRRHVFHWFNMDIFIKEGEKKRWWCTFPGPLHHVHPQGDCGIRPPLSIRKCRSLPCRPSFPLWDQKEMYVTISMSITHCTTKKIQRRDANWDGGRLVFKRRGTLIFILLLQASDPFKLVSISKRLGGHLPTFIWLAYHFRYVNERKKFCNVILF